MTNLEDIKKRIRKDPKDPETNRLMGAAYLYQGNPKEALRYYKIASMFRPSIYPKVIIDFEEYIISNLSDVQSRLALVEYHLSQGNVDAAIIDLEELVEISPETAEIYNMLGRIYLKLGRLDGAISLLEKAMESGKGDPTLLEALAGAYIEKGRHADAIMLYEDLLKIDPSSKRVLRTLQELYKRLNNFDSAAEKLGQMLSDDPEVLSETLDRLEELLRLSPNSPTVLEKLAETYAKCLKPDKAVQCAKKLSELSSDREGYLVPFLKELLLTYPDNIDATELLAQCLTAKGQYSEAVEMYDNLMRQAPDLRKKSMEGYLKIISAFPDQLAAHQSLADCYMGDGNIKEALAGFRHIVKLDPSQLDHIERKCREILKADPSMTDALLVLAQGYISSGEARKAISVAEELVAKEKNCTPAFEILGQAFAKIDLTDRAKDSYRSALATQPYDTAIQKRFQAVSEKELDKEMETLKSKIEQDPWRAGLNLDLARLQHKRGQLDAAIRSLQKAIRDASRAPQSHILLGQIFKEQGRYDLAQAQFEKVLEFKTTEGNDWERTARAEHASCLEAQGMIEQALSEYEKVSQEDIGHSGVSSRVDRLTKVSSYSIRNKKIALAFDSATRSLRAVWGGDFRRTRANEDEDLTLMSFGQGQNNSGFDQFMKSRIKAAEDDFTLSSQLDSMLLPSVNNLACVLLHNGETEKARTLFMSCVSGDKGNSIYHNNYGVMLKMAGEADRAESEFRSALKTDKDFSPALLNLGDVEMERGRVKEALSLYRKIGPLDPMAEQSRRRLLFWI